MQLFNPCMDCTAFQVRINITGLKRRYILYTSISPHRVFTMVSSVQMHNIWPQIHDKRRATSASLMAAYLMDHSQKSPGRTSSGPLSAPRERCQLWWRTRRPLLFAIYNGTKQQQQHGSWGWWERRSRTVSANKWTLPDTAFTRSNTRLTLHKYSTKLTTSSFWNTLTGFCRTFIRSKIAGSTKETNVIEPLVASRIATIGKTAVQNSLQDRTTDQNTTSSVLYRAKNGLNPASLKAIQGSRISPCFEPQNQLTVSVILMLNL